MRDGHTPPFMFMWYFRVAIVYVAIYIQYIGVLIPYKHV